MCSFLCYLFALLIFSVSVTTTIRIMAARIQYFSGQQLQLQKHHLPSSKFKSNPPSLNAASVKKPPFLPLLMPLPKATHLSWIFTGFKRETRLAHHVSPDSSWCCPASKPLPTPPPSPPQLPQQTRRVGDLGLN
ncbi:hypothetical protein F3Y22_tig00110223pilonHSYRG00325 [Hibiscus syriacus]|uniref:Uncharacterized protein n=1 Tax=Hibiscus syriacus TaxID=106335 RepID=A0A6A3B6S6_HIBSY|nr:hypothetical protein F3Y22_tig00110223pilonHSYRG00325 [Hibiscus syriacus]